MELPSPLSAALTLLPRVFSPHPTPLEPDQLSQPLQLSHRFLSISPTSAAYYQLLPSTELSSRFNEIIERGLDLLEPREAGYHVDQDDLLSRVSLGGDVALDLQLRWEEETTNEDGENNAAGWKLHTLSLPSNGTRWHSTLAAALEAFTQSNSSSNASSRPEALDLGGETKKGRNREEMAEGEGTTPGAYGSAGDFWDGWSDDESPSTSTRPQTVSEESEEAQAQGADEIGRAHV